MNKRNKKYLDENCCPVCKSISQIIDGDTEPVEGTTEVNLRKYCQGCGSEWEETYSFVSYKVTLRKEEWKKLLRV